MVKTNLFIFLIILLGLTSCNDWGKRFTKPLKSGSQITNLKVWTAQGDKYTFSRKSDLDALYFELCNQTTTFLAMNNDRKTVNANYLCTFPDGTVLDYELDLFFYDDRIYLLFFYPEFPDDQYIGVRLDELLLPKTLLEFRKAFLKGESVPVFVDPQLE